MATIDSCKPRNYKANPLRRRPAFFQGIVMWMRSVAKLLFSIEPGGPGVALVYGECHTSEAEAASAPEDETGEKELATIAEVRMTNKFTSKADRRTLKRVLVALSVLAIVAISWHYRKVLVFSALTVAGRNSPCTVGQVLAAPGHYEMGGTASEDVARHSRLVKRDPDYELWDTPYGHFWIPANNTFLAFDLSEQRRRIYGDGADGVQSGDVVLDCGANVGVFARSCFRIGREAGCCHRTGARECGVPSAQSPERDRKRARCNCSQRRLRPGWISRLQTTPDQLGVRQFCASGRVGC